MKSNTTISRKQITHSEVVAYQDIQGNEFVLKTKRRNALLVWKVLRALLGIDFLLIAGLSLLMQYGEIKSPGGFKKIDENVSLQEPLCTYRLSYIVAVGNLKEAGDYYYSFLLSSVTYVLHTNCAVISLSAFTVNSTSYVNTFH